MKDPFTKNIRFSVTITNNKGDAPVMVLEFEKIKDVFEMIEKINEFTHEPLDFLIQRYGVLDE